MNDKEKKIKEARTIEATRKGISEKLNLIVRVMGQPILTHYEGGLFSDHGGNSVIGMTSTSAPLDYYEEEENDEYDTLEMLDAFGQPIENPQDDTWSESKRPRKRVDSHIIGWYFDGLNRGVHLEIKYMEEISELTVHYKGYLVFKEIGGDLQAYNPTEWEDKIMEFHKSAQKMHNVNRKEEKKEREVENLKAKQSWIKQMRDMWGL